MTAVDRFGVWLSQRAIRRRLPRRSDLEVLELGCGYRAGAADGPCATGIKHGTGSGFPCVAPELLRNGGLHLSRGADRGDAAGAWYRPVAFDAIVLLISVLEHLRDAPAALEGVGKLLRPGGVLLLNVPTWRGKCFLEFSAFRLGLSPKVEMDDHKMYYDKKDLWPLSWCAPVSGRAKSGSFITNSGLNLFGGRHQITRCLSTTTGRSIGRGTPGPVVASREPGPADAA